MVPKSLMLWLVKSEDCTFMSKIMLMGYGLTEIVGDMMTFGRIKSYVPLVTSITPYTYLINVLDLLE